MDDSSSSIDSGIPPSPEAPSPQEPTTYVNQEVIGRKFHMSKKLFMVAAITVVLGVTVFLLQYTPGSKMTSNKNNAIKTTGSAQDAFIKKSQTFLTSPQDQDIATYLAMGEEEKKYEAGYDHYVKAYNALKVRYTLSKDPKYYFLLSDLKKYIIIFPQYKASDLK